jgi:hypothetical protein
MEPGIIHVCVQPTATQYLHYSDVNHRAYKQKYCLHSYDVCMLGCFMTLHH